MTVIINGPHGLGDNISQRPFVRAFAEREDVYLRTPWPQLYRDLSGVKCLPAKSRLRTQAKNEARGYTWHEPPAGAKEVSVHYGSRTMLRGSLHDEIERLLPLHGRPYVNDLPDFGPSPVATDRPIAVVRPVTVRSEWSAVARNCRPEYIGEAAGRLRAAGYHVVTVADVEGNAERLLGAAPPADTAFLRGELMVEQLMALIAHAAIVVTPFGFMVHAAIAYRRPMIVVAGGRGQHCAPWKETDPRQDLTRVRFMIPDVYCMCDKPDHDCPKTISEFEHRFARTLDSLRLPAPRPAAAAAEDMQERVRYCDGMLALP